ncbi:MAG: hypothetical protein M1835_004068 [Candelina submexicana]|nr:MAG: hypothetical protein M1835_004068 [Candelina submexicana]
MASSADETWRFALQVWETLKVKLAEKESIIPDFTELLSQYRSACENTIFQDFEFATNHNVESRLWDAHGKVNNQFRKALSCVSLLLGPAQSVSAATQAYNKPPQVREANGKKTPVEKRKTVKKYLEFIKSSQRFYRGYIQRLASHFGGIPELEQVAHRFSLSTLSAESPVQISPHMRHLIRLSCHATLIRLGDLSRYRETETTTKDRNWGPAIGYYDLAGAIYSSSGASHHQLAVIALADGNHLSTTYHLYRALAVEEPHPGAKGNLEIEFKKISVAWDRGELISNDSPSGTCPGKALAAWFMRLHARCYRGEEFAEHDELESEVLSQLAIDLKERSLGRALHKFILINIAAESFAATRLQEDQESKAKREAFYFFLRLNVKTFFTLLQLLQPELEGVIGDDVGASDGDHPSNDTEKITAVARRILPGLRHYSSWLLSRAELLAASGDESSLTVQIKELWREYVNTLNLVYSTFPEPTKLPVVEYLLEEDEDTIGFKPFSTPHIRGRYYADDVLKPKFHDQGIERSHPNVEMLARVREFLRDGLELAWDKVRMSAPLSPKPYTNFAQTKFPNIPIALIGGRLVYQEEGVPSELLASPNGHHTTSSVPSVEREDMPHLNDSSPPAAESTTTNAEDEEDASLQRIISTSEAASTSISMDPSMKRMVDSLVNSSTSDLNEPDLTPPFKTFIPPTPPEHSLEDPFNAATAVHETTYYGPSSTLTAKALVDMTRSHSQSSTQLRHTPRQTPRPTLPSIWNTPFAPQSSDSSPLTRPSTARRTSPSQAPPVQWVNSLSSTSQTASTMPDPSGGYYPGSGIGARLGVGDETCYAGASVFDQSILSPWGVGGMASCGSGDGSGSGRVARVVMGQTPPNGQGGGG